MARPPTASEQRQAMLQKYNDKLARKLAQARANNIEEARRKNQREQGMRKPTRGHSNREEGEMTMTMIDAERGRKLRRALVAKLEELEPLEAELEEWKENRAKHEVVLAEVKAETERHHKIRADHQAAVDELRREREQLRQEVAAAQHDRNRLRREADELATWLKITKFQHRVG